jgi:hypothetical protein
MRIHQGRNARQLAGVIGVALVALVGACGGAGGTPSSPGSRRPSGSAASPVNTPARNSFDPPLRFDPASGVALPGEAGAGSVSIGGQVVQPLPVALSDLTAYVAGRASLRVVDAGTGTVQNTVRSRYEPLPEARPSSGHPAGAPLIINAEAGRLLLVPFLVSVPGHGTTPQRPIVELTAADVATGGAAWTAQLDLPPWASRPTARLTATMVGVHGHVAVIHVADVTAVDAGDRDSQITYGVDLDTRRPRWQRDSFDGATLAGSVVVGSEPTHPGSELRVLALTADDGKQRWTGPTGAQVDAQRAGAALVAVETGAGARWSLQFFQAENGEPAGSTRPTESPLTCRYDDTTAVTVCAPPLAGTRQLIETFDAASGTLLWQLPDTKTNRTAPVVTAVWHGAVYGRTDNGPVILDARTGADKNDSPGLAPYAVNGYVGLALDVAGHTVTAYRAVG